MKDIVHIRKKKLKSGYCLYLDFVSPKDGKRHKKYLNLHINNRDKTNTAETMLLAARYRDELLEELYKPDGIPTFCNYVRSINIDELQPSTKRNRDVSLRILESYDSSVMLDKLTRKWMVGFIAYLKKQGNSPSTINIRMYFIKSILRHAFKNDVLVRVPDYSGLAPKVMRKPRQFLTLEEIQRFALVKTEWEKYKNAFLFACFTGLRWSDILQLQYSHIKNNVLTIQMQKTKECVSIPLTDNAKLFLPPYRGNSFVFFDLKPNSAHFNRKLKEICADAGIYKKISFHCARHSFATNLLACCNNIFVVSKLLGHRSVKTTQVYAHCILKNEVEALGTVPSIFRLECAG